MELSSKPASRTKILRAAGTAANHLLNESASHPSIILETTTDNVRSGNMPTQRKTTLAIRAVTVFGISLKHRICLPLLTVFR